MRRNSLIRNTGAKRSFLPLTDFIETFNSIFEAMEQVDRWSPNVFDDIQPSTRKFPKINVMDAGDFYEVEIAVAGYAKDEIELELKNNMLFISGKKESEENSEDKKFLCREISYRSFKRGVRFVNKVDPDNIECAFKDGIVTLTIGKIKKPEEESGLKIKIN